MNWIFLLIAGIFEICWAIGLKYCNGFNRPLPLIFAVSSMIGSMGFLMLALKTIPIGTAYAVWTGIGVIGTTIFGIVLLGEPKTTFRISCILLIIIGVIGLKLSHR